MESLFWHKYSYGSNDNACCISFNYLSCFFLKRVSFLTFLFEWQVKCSVKYNCFFSLFKTNMNISSDWEIKVFYFIHYLLFRFSSLSMISSLINIVVCCFLSVQVVDSLQIRSAKCEELKKIILCCQMLEIVLSNQWAYHFVWFLPLQIP